MERAARSKQFGAGAFLRKGAVLAGVAAMTLFGFAASASAHNVGPRHPHPHRPYARPYATGFVKVAERRVGDRFDRDVISLPGRRRFSEIKLCVRRRAVEFVDLDVVFANGGNQDIGVRRVIYPGECTRNIRLRGRGPRNIEHIIMKYTALRKQGPQPYVAVYAR